MFGTFDLVAMMALGSAVVLICGTIVGAALQDDRPKRAQLGAEALAHQMIAGGFGPVVPERADEEFVAAPKSGDRGPASVGVPTNGNARAFNSLEGVMGRDPWGRPYRYKLLRSSGGQPVRILVWSEGPNERSDTRSSEFDIALSTPRGSIRFGGDDIGFVFRKN